MLQVAQRKSQVRAIYLTKLETSQIILKKQIIFELKSYADKKRHQAQIEYHTVMQLRLSKKKQLFKELASYTVYKRKLKIADKKANLSMKKRVLTSMASTIKKQIMLSNKYAEFKTTHYRTYCIDLFRAWHAKSI